MFISSSWTSPPRLWHHCFHATKRLGGRLFCSFVGLLVQLDPGSKKTAISSGPLHLNSDSLFSKALRFSLPPPTPPSTYTQYLCDLFHRHTAPYWVFGCFANSAPRRQAAGLWGEVGLSSPTLEAESSALVSSFLSLCLITLHCTPFGLRSSTFQSIFSLSANVKKFAATLNGEF